MGIPTKTCDTQANPNLIKGTLCVVCRFSVVPSTLNCNYSKEAKPAKNTILCDSKTWTVFEVGPHSTKHNGKDMRQAANTGKIKTANGTRCVADPGGKEVTFRYRPSRILCNKWRKHNAETGLALSWKSRKGHLFAFTNVQSDVVGFLVITVPFGKHVQKHKVHLQVEQYTGEVRCNWKLFHGKNNDYFRTVYS